jgi:glucose/mannose-6-phosphate isomerase
MVKNEVDKEDLYSVIEKMPGQLVEGLEIAKNIKVEGKFKSVTISGMGGSALPANLLRIYLNDLFRNNSKANHRFGIFQNRFYSLPPEAYRDSLNIISSYSGNTEETVSAFKDALSNKLPCVGVAAGGKVAEMCKENNVPLVLMPPPEIILQPRMATACNFAALFSLLANSGMIEDRKSDFEKNSKLLQDDVEEFRAQGENIAKRIKGKTPVVYASTKFKSLAMIWKIMINENAKTPAFWNYFPELNHNEMIGFTNPQSQLHLLILRDNLDDPRNLKRVEVTAKILKEYNVDSSIIDMPEGDLLYRIFGTLQIGCWASYYLALEYGVDPTPVEMVEKLKELLTK